MAIEWNRKLKGRKLGAAKSAAIKTGCSLETWLLNREMGQNWCFRCKKWKPISWFHPDRTRVSGYASQCKECQSIASTASRYRISAKRAMELLEAPCAICQMRKAVAIDHCHKTGKVRAGLCSQCNVGMGLFGDDPLLLAKAIRYLEEHDGS